MRSSKARTASNWRNTEAKAYGITVTCDIGYRVWDCIDMFVVQRLFIEMKIEYHDYQGEKENKQGGQD